MLLAYFGPETLMPLTSILAAVAGFVLMFGRQGVRLVRYTIGQMVRLVVPSSGMAKTAMAMPDRNLRRDSPARSRYRRPAHHEHEVEQDEAEMKSQPTEANS